MKNNGNSNTKKRKNRRGGGGGGRQHSFAASFFIYLCLVLFAFTACPTPFFELPGRGYPEVGEEAPQSTPGAAPAGMGYFSLSVNSATRTILPTAPVFATYGLSFVPNASGINGNSEFTIYRTPDNLEEPILLYAGKWDLVVIAYTDEGDADNLPVVDVASGRFPDNSPDGFLIGDGGVTGGNVELRPIPSGSGTFRWSVDFPDGVSMDSANMVITPYGAGTGASVNLLEGTSGDTELASGYYRVDINLESGDKKAALTQILHIQTNLVSVYSHRFTASNFSGILSGVIAIEGNGFGEGDVLTVDTSGLNGDGELYYRWYRDGTPAGAGETYTITAASGDTPDSAIKVEVYRAGYNGSAESDPVTVALTLLRITASYTQTISIDVGTTELDDIKDDITVTAYYSDGDEVELDNGDYELSGTLSVGVNTITVKYEGKEADFTIDIGVTVTSITAEYALVEGMVLTSIDINNLKAGLTVTARYNTEETRELAATEYELSGTLAVGTNTITVNYNGLTASFTVEIEAIGLATELSLTPLPDGTYRINASPDAKGDVVIPAWINGVPVTAIADGAFRNNTKITSVTIPEGVTSIGPNTFYGCTDLESVSLPEGLTTIGNSAFYGCTSLESVSLPDELTTIGNTAFYGCSSLESINLPDELTTIGTGAFYNCTSLKGDIEIPEGVTSIGNDAFRGSSIESVRLPEGLTTIGNYAFIYCTSLTGEIEIPDSVTTIGNYAFYNCNSLERIILQEGLRTIGDNAFANCRSLTGIKIPSTVRSIGASAFYYCESLTGHVEIPEGVTTIGKEAFYYCINLESVKLPDGLTTIGDSAFTFCYSLTSIDIPSSVTRIGAHAFRSCTSLESVILQEEGLLTIGDSAFSRCTSLTGIDIPSTVTSIGASAFYICESLTGVVIPEGVTSIGNETFSNCYNLESVSLPEGLTSIGTYAFFACYSLTSIDIPEGVTSIGAHAFRSCTSLESVRLQEGLLTIGTSAFSGCTNLTSINNFPTTLKSIGDEAFRGCANLEIESVSLPNELTTIGTYTFYNCAKLTGDLVIPDGVTSIGTYAFSYTGFKSVSLPVGLTTISTGAFYGCSSLTSVTFDSVDTDISASNTFPNVDNLRLVYPIQGDGTYVRTGSEWAKKVD